MEESSGAPMSYLGAEKGTLKPTDTNHHRRLQKRDSGYNSPVTPGTTPDVESGTTSRTKSLHLGIQPTDSMQRFVEQHNRASGKNGGVLKKQLSSPGILDGAQSQFFQQYSHMEQQPQYSIMLGQQQQQQQQQQPFTCDKSSVLYFAYKCRELNHLSWDDCNHPYCIQVRNNLSHMATCFARAECQRCQQFNNQMYRHAESCTEVDCPVDMCRSIKQQLRQEFASLPYDMSNPFTQQQLQRRGSFDGDLHRQPSSLLSFSQFDSTSTSHILGGGDDSPVSRYIEARADEIVDKLDQEEPLLPLDPEPASLSQSLQPQQPTGRPGSLRHSAAMNEQAVNMLSPIAEDTSPSFGGHQILGGGPPSMNLASSAALGPNSIVREEEVAEIVYPDQQVRYQFRANYLRVGSDGHYYQRRDYDANEITKSGGFGTVRFAKDLTNDNMFAIKCNNSNSDSIIDSIDTEARLLSRLGPHENVIQMYGAVLDYEEHAFLPNRMFKLMIELAEHGNLSEMVLDPDTLQPLERDQALFYFWQVLKGVNFLHSSNILHLDIKGTNILVFDEGRTLKICDLGTALHVDDIASSVGKNLGTIQFSAPEICRQEMPGFSSDMWSTMCVLVEMLTGRMPWDMKAKGSSCASGLIFLIGNYRNEQMERDLIPQVEGGGEELDADIIDLMRLVFRAKGEDRETAINLLNHPLISTAYTYEAYFDEMSLEDENPPMEDEMPSYSSHPPTSLPLSLHTNEGNNASLHCEIEKRASKDSGTGQELEEMGTPYTRMSSSGMNSDSGLDTPYNMADGQILSSGKSIFTFASHPEESPSEYTDSDHRDFADKPVYSHLFTPSEGKFKSLPTPILQSDPITQVQRSFSLTVSSSHSPSTSYQQVGSNCGSCFQRCQCSYSRLRHSNSAPVIGGQYRRRLSLQSLHSYGNEETWSGAMPPSGKLRRISSETYVQRGPDIDSPNRVNHASSWEQDKAKLQSQQTHHLRTSHQTSDHAPFIEKPSRLVIKQPSPSNTNCQQLEVQSSHHIPTQEVRGQVVGGSVHEEGVESGEGSRGEVESEEVRRGQEVEVQQEDGETVETHITLQGRTFDIFKTVC